MPIQFRFPPPLPPSLIRRFRAGPRPLNFGEWSIMTSTPRFFALDGPKRVLFYLRRSGWGREKRESIRRCAAASVSLGKSRGRGKINEKGDRNYLRRPYEWLQQAHTCSGIESLARYGTWGSWFLEFRFEVKSPFRTCHVDWFFRYFHGD